MKTLRVGIIGTGNISRSHIKAIQGREGFELAGVADVSAEARKQASTAHGVPAFADHRALISSVKPDYVVVSTPHYYHAPITLDALDAGVHVFVEKPMAVDAAEAAACVSLAESRKRVLGVNFARRQGPNQRKMAELVREGFIGELIHATMICAKRYRNMAYYRSGDWRATWAGEGGGVTVNQAPHDLDFLLWVLGMPEKVLADMRPLGHDIEVEDDTTAIFHYANGANCTFYASTNVAFGRESFEVIGTKGRLMLDGNGLLTVALQADTRVLKADQKPRIANQETLDLPDDGDKLHEMHANFRRAVLNGEALCASGAEGLQEVQLANALLVSAIRQRWVTLPPDPTAYRTILDTLVKTRSMDETRRFASATGV